MECLKAVFEAPDTDIGEQNNGDLTPGAAKNATQVCVGETEWLHMLLSV